MKTNKYVTTRKLLVSVLCILIACCLAVGFALTGNKKSDAYETSSTSVATPLFDFEKYCYSEEALDSLASQLVGHGSNFEDLLSYAKNTAGTQGLPISNGSGSITTLKYGRYRFTTQSIYKPLVWLPVYISRSNSGDAILTLYLAGTEDANSSTSQQEALTFSNSGTYSTDYTCTAPSNSYSTSHMRSINLGNVMRPTDPNNISNDKDKKEFVGDYAYYDANHTSYVKMYNTGEVNENHCNKFSDFIMGTNFIGLLYEDIATPSELEWQGDQVSKNYLNAGTPYSAYNWPNDAYKSTVSGDFSNSAFDYFATNKTYYDRWKDDKVWLPSLTEVGTGDNGISGPDTTDGIWKLNKSQRSNKAVSWLRSANTVEDKGEGYSTYTMWATAKDGSITTADVNQTCAIRPAIHLNLSKISSKTTEPVNLPETVTSIYTGEVQTITQEKHSWYFPEDMTISFFMDEDCTMPVAPINAGTYYMMVELKISSDRYFLGEDRGKRLKSTKFVVEKIKLGVIWTYDDTVLSLPPPVKVEVTDGEHTGEDVFLQRDRDAGNIPEIGMKHSNVTGAGIIDSPEFPDKVGYYTARAYIVDEDIHNYNYELSGSSLTSHQFFVGQTKVPEPYFLTDEGGTPTSIEVGYKGRQWVQIANVSKYIDIEITVSKTKGQNAAEQEASAIEAKNKMVDLGVSTVTIGGEEVQVHTYELTDIGEYTFKAILKDTINTIWESSSENGDYTPKNLVMRVNQAYLTVTFDGLPSSWESARPVSFDINILGIYDSSESVSLEVYYAPYGNDSNRTRISNSSGRYVIPANACSPGNYNVYAMLSGTSQYTSNYRMEKAVYQKFTITRTQPKFEDSNANWIFKTSDAPSIPKPSASGIAFNAHNTPENPYELEYTGNYYSFSLAIPDSQLHSVSYYVRATYTGETYVKDAGLHSVTVTITAYDKNLEFTPKVYTIYFNISKAQYDLSNVKWNYTTPFIYSGNEHRVFLNPGSLPAGLLVSYETNGDPTNAMIAAGTYTTKAVFRVSDEFSANWKLPVDGNPESYTGDAFSFTLEWVIDKKTLTAEWTTPSGDTFFIPSLVNGHTFVDYTFEKENGGNWEACTSITAPDSGSANYRVTATLKADYAVNYVLTGTASKEFTVQANQFAVSVHFEVDGKSVENEEQFTYTGQPLTVTAVLDTPDGSSVTMTAGAPSYFSVTGGGSTAVSNATNVGKYRVDIPLTFTSGSNTFNQTAQYYFEIIKADIDISGLYWVYAGHDGNNVNAYYDGEQGKWLDADGNEVTFSYVYDGEEHVLDMGGMATGVQSFTVTGDKSATNANSGSNKYTANVSFVYDTANYNAPQFPATLEWNITKAKVNFEKVRWGYIDSDGNEHEFDFKNDSFVFTRVDGQDAPVKFTVALINLPSAVKGNADGTNAMIRYYTTSYTDNSFGTKFENSFSAIGEYCTSFEVANVSTNPNYEFTNADIPANLAKSQDWQIVERELTEPYYDGSWTKFDNRTHDLIELSGMPRDELCYFSVEITFINTANVIQNNYKGYKGDGVTEDYYAKLAGTYIVRFYELRGDNAQPYIWGTVEIEVAKEELEVTWDLNGALPVARVTGIYVSNMLGTRYTNTSGGEVTEAFIRTTDGVTFYAEPYITDEYPDFHAKNITFVMAEGQVQKREFVSSQFHFNPGTTQELDKPVLENASLEFNGKAQTFVISNWNTYSYYLYISDGGLTQTNIGEYSVKLSFKKDADAVWRNPNNSEDREDFTLKYKIVVPKRVPIDKPVFKEDSMAYTGEVCKFEIVNWSELSKYLVMEGDDLSKVDAGTYTVVFRFITDVESQGYWSDDGSQSDYELTFTIFDPTKMIANPAVANSTLNYTGDPLTFVISNWDAISDFVELTGYDTNKVSVNGGVITITDVGVYEIKVNITADGRTFANGTTSYTLRLIVAGTSQGLPKPQFESSQIDFNGEPVTFEIKGWNELYADYLQIEAPEGVEVNGGKLTVSAAGKYEIKISFKGSGNWINGGSDPITLTFYAVDSSVTPPPELTKLPESPVLVNDKREFTGFEISFAIKNWDIFAPYVTVKEGSLTQTAIGTYTVVLSIDATKATWFDGSTDDIVLEFEITKATLTLGTDENGNITGTNGDGEDVNIGDFLDPVYYDKDGNPVDKNDLKDGEEYDVKYEIKDEENFNNHFNNAEELKETITNNTYHVTYRKPAGFNWILIVCIAAGVLLLIIVIIIIIVSVKKRRAAYDYDDDYDEDYDGYEDYDDYDDYDEDYEETYDETYEDYDDDYYDE